MARCWPLRRCEGNADLSAEARARLAELERAAAATKQLAEAPIPMALAAQGGVPQGPYEGFHDVRIHVRGTYTRQGDLVPRHMPRILAGDDQPKIESGSGRLEWPVGSRGRKIRSPPA